MTQLDRAAIRRSGLKRELVEVEEWGGEVFIRAMSVRDREEFVELYGGDDEDADNAPYPADVWLALKCVCDEDGNRLFGEDDASVLLDQPMSAVQRVGKACMKLNGLTRDAVEDAEKN